MERPGQFTRRAGLAALRFTTAALARPRSSNLLVINVRCGNLLTSRPAASEEGRMPALGRKARRGCQLLPRKASHRRPAAADQTLARRSARLTSNGSSRLGITVSSPGHGARGGTSPDRLRRFGGFPGRDSASRRALRRASGCGGNSKGPGWRRYRWGQPDTIGVGTLPPDPATVEAVDRLQLEHASTVAGDGAEFARSVGLAAEPQAVPDEFDVADTLIGIARELGAAVVVVGSHGISGLRSRLLGSVSRKLIEHCDRPASSSSATTARSLEQGIQHLQVLGDDQSAASSAARRAARSAAPKTTRFWVAT